MVECVAEAGLSQQRSLLPFWLWEILLNLSHCVKSWVIPNNSTVSARDLRLRGAIPFTRLDDGSIVLVDQKALLVPSASSTRGQGSATNWGVRLLIDQLTRQKWCLFFKFQTDLWVNNPFSCTVSVFHIQVNTLSSFPHTHTQKNVSLDQEGSVFSWNNFILHLSSIYCVSCMI